MSSPLPQRRRRLLGAFVASLALVGAAPTAAHAADTKLALTGVYAGPVGPAADVPGADDSYAGGRCARRANASGVYDSVKPLDAGAGTNTDQCIAFFLPTPDVGDGDEAASPDLRADTGDDIKDVTIDLPRGFQAAPAGVPTCSLTQFRVNPDGSQPVPGATIPANEIENTCPAGSVVGKARAQITLGTTYIELDDDVTVGNVYNLEAGPNEFARLGIEVRPGRLAVPTRSVVSFVLTSGPDPRLRAIVSGLPRTAYLTSGAGANRTVRPQPILISGVGILAWGNKAEHPELGVPAFAQNGTECGVDLAATASVVTYNGTTSTASSAPYRLSNCAATPFAPTVTLSDVEKAPGVPTPVTVDVQVPQAAAAPLSSLVKDVAVTMPAGLEVGAQVASNGGLPLCSPEAFSAATNAEPACPAGSAIGEARIETPLVSRPLVGTVFLGPQSGVGTLPKLYVVVTLQGATSSEAPRIKLVGTTTVGADGRVTATFADNPQLRFNRIQLKFRGGPNALFITPRRCGTSAGSATLTPSNGTGAVTTAVGLTIDAACDVPAFAPTVTVAPASTQAAATAPTTITIDRPDRSAWLKDVKVSLPSGLLANLKNAAECPAAAAASGACPESTRIGTVRVKAGAGAAPLALTGALYLVTPPAGAVAGAVIVVRAKIGDIDLGDVVVPGRIELRPTEAGLDFITSAPTRIYNLPLNMRTIEVALDRDAFALNPSACGPLGYGSTIAADTGEIANSGGSVTYTGCGNLPFAPSLRATLTGDVKPSGFPGMYVEVTNRPGDTNLRATTVVLPEGVSAATANIQTRCSAENFAAYTCPAATKVGTATATISITDDLVRGDIFLIQVPGETLPGLGLSFGGRYTQRVSSSVKINRQGRLAVEFGAIPDLPLRKLVVDVTGGPKGPLQLSRGDCAIGTQWDGTFTGQGGQTAVDRTGLRCAAASAVKVSDRRGFSLRNFDFGGRKLQSATITLPKGYAFIAKEAKGKGRSWARGAGTKPKLKFGKTTLRISTKEKNATTLRVKVSGKAVRRTSRKKLKKKATVNVVVRFAFTDGAIQSQTIKAPAS